MDDNMNAVSLRSANLHRPGLRRGHPGLQTNRNTNIHAKPAILARAGRTYHTVEKGEWLSSIAPKYGVSVSDLKEANHKAIGQNDMILPGQKLLVPKSGGSGVLIKVLLVLLVLTAISGAVPGLAPKSKN